MLQRHRYGTAAVVQTLAAVTEGDFSVSVEACQWKNSSVSLLISRLGLNYVSQGG